MDHYLLGDLVTVFGLSIAVLLLCHRLGIPTLVGLIITGIAAGPKSLSIIENVHEVEQLAEIGIILLLFTVGMEFSPKNFLRMRRMFLLGGTLQVGITLLGGFAVAQLLSRPFGESLFLGCMLSLSSTAIVLKLLSDRLETRSAHGKAAITMLIFQDIMVVPMILLVPVFAGSTPDVGVNVGVQIALGLAVLLVTIWLSARLLPKIFAQVARTQSREVFLLAVLVVCFGVAWASSAAGLSLSLGAFLAGLLISDTEYRHQAVGDLLPLQGVFTSFFFVSIGMLVDVQFVLEHLLIVLITAFGVVSLKAGTVVLVCMLLRFSLRESLLAGFCLAQIGEFAFVLAKAGMDHNLSTPFHHQLFLAVSLLTMMATPFLLLIAPRISQLIERLPIARWFSRHGVGMEHEVQQNHVVIIGLSETGRIIAHACRQLGIPYQAMDIDRDAVERAHQEQLIAEIGDATDPLSLQDVGTGAALLLIITPTDIATARRIAGLAKHQQSDIKIFGRCIKIADLDALHAANIDACSEEQEGALALTSNLLDYLQVTDTAREGIEQELRLLKL